MTDDDPKNEAKPEAGDDGAASEADPASVKGMDTAQKAPKGEVLPASSEDDAPSAPTSMLVGEEEEEEKPTGVRRFVPLILAGSVPALFFLALPPLSRSGLWDPYELNVADLARRLSLNLFHASDLALTGTDNSLPHLNDLGRPELPFDSIALGFRMFGLHEWAGRLPLALWGLLGVVSTYGFVSRLVDKRAGVYAAVALSTMPLYFVQARTMLGDVVTMCALAMSFGGLAVAVFDRDEKGPRQLLARLPWLALGLCGLVVGYYSRGGIIGISIPLAAIGLAWALSWAAGGRELDRVGDAVGGVALLAGAAVLYMGVRALGAEKTTDLSMWIGAMVKVPPKYPTFDYFIGHLGPALAPWSAFVPFALGRLFLPPVRRTGAVFQRESYARMALLVGAAVAFAAHGYLGARTELIAFSAPALLAAACGIAIRDYERGAHPSVAVGVGTAVFLGVFHHDFHELPEKAYQAFAVVGAPFPESFKEHALVLWTVALIGFAIVGFLTWVERDSTRQPFEPKNYLHIIQSLREAWDGLLALAYFAMVAGASLAGLAIWVGVRTHAKWLPTLSLQIRDGVLNAWWITAFVPLGAILGIFFACDVWLWAFGRAKKLSFASFTRGFEPFEELYDRLRGKDTSKQEKAVAGAVLVPFMVLAVPAAVMGYLATHGTRPMVAAALGVPAGVAFFLALGIIGDLLRGSRAAFFPLTGALVGLVLCFSYFPALANQLSPKEVFESYQRLHKGNEPLGLFGVGGRTSAYYAGGQPASFSDTQSAYAWLMAEPNGRRFLAMKADELARLNQLYRDRSIAPGAPGVRVNLPVLDARSSQILLVASQIENDKNQNPLAKIILSAPPKPQHKLDVNMEDRLQVLGYDVTDQSGHLMDVVAPGRKYRMRTYYRVLSGGISTEWEAFIHIDGFHRRHNGDHKPMDGKYPFALWLKDDLLVDDYEFALEPNFSPGAYTVYFGLFVGDTRLKVKTGPSDGDNRINGGNLNVQ